MKIPETLGINVLYPHVGVCRMSREREITVLRVYGRILRHSQLCKCAKWAGTVPKSEIIKNYRDSSLIVDLEQVV